MAWRGGRKGGEWLPRGCTAHYHYDRTFGIFFWQNDPRYAQAHVLQDFALFRNGFDGVVQGAYLSNVTYARGVVFENGTRGRSQWRSLVGWNNRIDEVTIDAGRVSEYALKIREHRTAKDVPTVVAGVDLRGGTVAAVGVREGTVSGYYYFSGVTVDGSRDLEPSDFAIVAMADGSRIRVQRRDGSACVLRGSDRNTAPSRRST